MKTITLSNNFHNTEAHLVPQPITNGQYKGYFSVTRKVALRVAKQLCPHADCTCGGNFGERGGTPLYVVEDLYERGFIVSPTCE